jgi:hypothetical protein
MDGTEYKLLVFAGILLFFVLELKSGVVYFLQPTKDIWG